MARQRDTNSALTRTLASGATAQFTRDGDAFTLNVDGTPQSQVNLLDPTELAFAYIRHMGHVLDLALPRGPVTAIHLGAGALTVPRYLEAAHPGSRQQVIELERDLVEFVREVTPLPASASIRLRYGDAREQLAKLPQGLRGTADALVVDVFAGARTPAHVTSLEFFELAATFLAPEGVLLVNIADGHDLAFARREVATIREAVGPVTLVSDPSVFKGRRFGNIVAAASRTPLDVPALPRLVASGFPPATVMTDAQAARWQGTARVAHDADATPSPLPGRSAFALREQASEW